MSLQQPLQITLTLLEGPSQQCDRPVAVSTWDQADAMLAHWDRYNMVNGVRSPGYLKANVTVNAGLPYVDSYTLRYDIGSETGDREGLPNLRRRVWEGMIGYAEFLVRDLPLLLTSISSGLAEKMENDARLKSAPAQAEELLRCAEFLRDQHYEELSSLIERAVTL